MKGSFYAVGQYANECREAIAQASLTLAEACERANAAADTYTIRYWNEVAQAARRVLVNYGALPAESL